MASRDIGYTNAEDVIPHENYLEITQDPIVGSTKPPIVFWNVLMRFTMNEWEKLRAPLNWIVAISPEFYNC